MANEKTKGGKSQDGDTVVIKKYANRRLYNTRTSSYVTLEDLARMVREGIDFVVYDAKSNDDLTRQILTQIIFEEENRGEALLPVQFLRQLIGFYGGQMQGVLPSYLEMSLTNFSKQQEQFASQMSRTFGSGPGASFVEEATKTNLAMFQRAMQMFPGFGYARADQEQPSSTTNAAGQTGNVDALAQMRRQMDEMRAQLDKMAGSGDAHP